MLAYSPKEEAKKIAINLLDRLSAQDGITSKDFWQLYKKNAPQEKYGEERILLNRLVDIIQKVNESMVSPQLIYQKILYMIIGVIIDNPLYKDEYLPKIDETLDNLLGYTSTRPIDVPVINLELEEKPFHFGEVSFLPITEGDRVGIWWDSINGALGGTAFQCVKCYGRVSALGDLDTSTIYAGPIVDDALLLLRGISFPFTVEEVVQFGAVGDVSINRARLYRLGKPEENIHLEHHSEWVGRLGPPLGPYYLYTDLLSKVDDTNLRNFYSLIEKEGFNPKGTMSAKVLRGFRWIGEASKLDILPARFTKLTFALENLIGGDPRDERLSSSGLTAMLAERAAFLVGKNQTERLGVDSDVRRFYGKRSDIVHGRRVDISEEEITQFSSLVRNVAFSLLGKLDQFQSIDNLQSWIKEQRYL